MRYLPLYVLTLLLLPHSRLGAQDKALCYRYADRTIQWFEGQQYDSIYGIFDQTMQKAMPLDKLGALWPQLLAQAGDLKEVGNSYSSEYQDYILVEKPLVFVQKSFTMRLAFNKKNEIAGMFFVPLRTARQPAQASSGKAYREQELVVKSGRLRLPGILCLPAGHSSYPLVVLVHGSGPNDRDESIGPNKIFRDIAHQLAAMGIGTLRYDKRSYLVAEGADSLPLSGLDAVVIDDAVAAVALARSLVPADNNVFVAGHSLGAGLGPVIARRAKADGLIMMAPYARHLEDIVVSQYRYIYRLDGLTMGERRKLCHLKRQARRAKNIDRYLGRKKVPDLPLINDTAFWRDVVRYRPLQTAESLQMPVLIVWGERDYQVNAEDFHLWQKHFGNKKNFTIRSYPGLNHLFIAGSGPSTPEEYQKKGNVSAEVLSDIASWIKTNN